MKVFISSVIAGFADFRNAATRGCATLKHQPLKAEDFGATAGTPQQVCLAGIRSADVVCTILSEVRRAAGFWAFGDSRRVS